LNASGKLSAMTLVDFVTSTDKHGQLMLAYAGGDMAAFETLYSHYKGPLYRFFLRQCGSSALAEELYQELWLRVINHRSHYQHKARFSTWIYHIAQNLLVDHFRKHAPEQQETELDELEGDPYSDPSEHYSSQEKVTRFLGMLRSLPDEQRQVFLLKEEAGLSLDEIAQVTGHPFEAVKSRLRYAVKKLRQAIEEPKHYDEQTR
jgi:RNA polymerase sigma-70 factor (ECF subfamily)